MARLSGLVRPIFLKRFDILLTRGNMSKRPRPMNVLRVSSSSVIYFKLETLWVVDADFPVDLLPPGTGLVIADAYDAEIIRMGAEHKLPAPRRRALIRKFARATALRLHRFRDQGL